jgi:hypothetical protein
MVVSGASSYTAPRQGRWVASDMALPAPDHAPPPLNCALPESLFWQGRSSAIPPISPWHSHSAPTLPLHCPVAAPLKRLAHHRLCTNSMSDHYIVPPPPRTGPYRHIPCRSTQVGKTHLPYACSVTDPRAAQRACLPNAQHHSRRLLQQRDGPMGYR